MWKKMYFYGMERNEIRVVMGIVDFVDYSEV